jgi:hypothetical protein
MEPREETHALIHERRNLMQLLYLLVYGCNNTHHCHGDQIGEEDVKTEK